MTTNGITQADPTNTQINEKQKQETKLLGEMVESIWGLPENEAGIGKKKKREREIDGKEQQWGARRER